MTAADILGNPAYPAISYGGYRKQSRDEQPSLSELKEDMKILSAIGIKVIRTYNVQFPHAGNLLKVIRQLKDEDETFEMYVMLGIWIDCKNAWTDLPPDHEMESEQNAGEIARATRLAKEYDDIVKVLAVGNEAMVKWQENYYVQPEVILQWVNHLQKLKGDGQLPMDLWITCSDDFASWGGGEEHYRTPVLEELIKAVDYISMHTYPYHNSHYNPQFWWVPDDEDELSKVGKVDAALVRALDFSKKQYETVATYVQSLGISKPIHIGETGWSTVSNGLYGDDGSRATDEYKQGLFYRLMREWTEAEGISCFYFEAFDEQWKDAGNPMGSENHFGLFTLDGQAKYPVWEYVDSGALEGLGRDGQPITKTYDGNLEALMAEVAAPPSEPAVTH